MSEKSPSFQFYVKDWRSSPTVRSMSREERGTYIDLLALAWECEGFLIGPISEIARAIPGCNVRSITSFLDKFPQCFPKVSPNFDQTLTKHSPNFDQTWVNMKLRKQWEETNKFKQTLSDAGKAGNEIRWGKPSPPDSGGNRSASAPASASKEQILSSNSPLPENGEFKLEPVSASNGNYGKFYDLSWDYYLRVIGRNGERLIFTKQRRKMAELRFKECLQKCTSHKPEDALLLMESCIDEMAVSKFHHGENPSGNSYLEWKHLFDSTERMERWIEKSLKRNAGSKSA